MRVNQNTQNFAERPEGQLGRNHFDHSYPHIDTFSMGEIVPFFWTETMPNDYWELSSEHFYRFPPTYLPPFQRINVQVAYFYIPNRIIWPGKKQDSWEWFIRDEASVQAPYVNMPVNNLSDQAYRTTTIFEHFGIPSLQTEGDVSIDTLRVNCLILSAYLIVWDEYYRNDQIQGARFFELTGGDNSTAMDAAFPVITWSGGNTHYTCLRRNWNRDYFTSATPTPQVGNNVLVPMMQNQTVDFDSTTTVADLLKPRQWRNLVTQTAAPAGRIFTDTSGMSVVENTDNPVYLDIQESAASIRDLRFALMLTEYLEKLMRLGDRYRDFIKGMWKVDPFPLLVDRPAYLGGSTGMVSISEVMSHAEIGNTPTNVVGSYSGQLLHVNSTGKVRYHCMEHGFIIGLVSVYPKSMYMQGLHRAWTRTTKYDYPLDQFNFIGDDALFNQEVMFSYLTADNDGDVNAAPGQGWNGQIFGYIPRYSEWRYRNAVVSGQMRDSQGFLFSFHLARFFDVNASSDILLNSEFIECKPDKKRMFVLSQDEDVTTEEEVYCYIWNEAHVKRQLSKFGIPGL